MTRSKMHGAFLGSDLVDFLGVALVDFVGVMQSSME